MQKLKLKVKHVLDNGAVVMVPERAFESFKVKKGTDKKLSEKEIAKLQPGEFDMVKEQVHPSCKLQFTVLDNDKTGYKEGDLYEVTLQKVK